MAQGAKGRRTRRRRTMHNPKKKGPSNKSLNKKIKHIENNLLELKYLDISSGQSPTTAGTSDYLTPLAQGDTASNRQGNIINPTSIQFRGTMLTDVDYLGFSKIRIILFWDRQPNGAVPVLTGASTTQSLLDNGNITDSTICPRNFNTIDRYHILYDKTHGINPGVVQTSVVAADPTTTKVVQRGKYIHFVVKLGRLVKYNNTSAAITAAVSNALHIAYFIDNGPAAGQAPVIQTGLRLYYRDS